jgi:hypothetical protein
MLCFDYIQDLYSCLQLQSHLLYESQSLINTFHTSKIVLAPLMDVICQCLFLLNSKQHGEIGIALLQILIDIGKVLLVQMCWVVLI